MAVIIKECVCKHAFQDEAYGKNKRLLTVKDKSLSNGIYTKGSCTVCGK